VVAGTAVVGPCVRVCLSLCVPARPVAEITRYAVSSHACDHVGVYYGRSLEPADVTRAYSAIRCRTGVRYGISVWPLKAKRYISAVPSTGGRRGRERGRGATQAIRYDTVDLRALKS